MNLTELKKKSAKELVEMAEELGIDNMGRSRKHDVIFAILKAGAVFVVVNPTYLIPSEEKLDKVYDLPYTRLPHPKYRSKAPIPAYEMIKFSINTHRGCFGGCSFCTISAHQGKFIASRSEKSILNEVKQVTQMEDFKGYISDLGGPSANMYKLKGKVKEICDRCVAPSCIHPVVCDNLDTNHSAMTEIYKKVDAMPEVKKAFIGSGIRYDLLTRSYNKKADDSLEPYMEQVLRRHVSGRLKVGWICGNIDCRFIGPAVSLPGGRKLVRFLF